MRLAAYTLVKNVLGFESVSGREFSPDGSDLEPSVYLTKAKKVVENGSVESLWSQDYRDFKAIPAEDLDARVKYVREKSPDKFSEKIGEAVSRAFNSGLTRDELALLPDIDDEGLGAHAVLSQSPQMIPAFQRPSSQSADPRLNAVGGVRNAGGEAGARMDAVSTTNTGYKRMGKFGDSWLPQNDYLSNEEIKAKRTALTKWRQLARDRKDVQDYESELMRQNAWTTVIQAKKAVGTAVGQEIMDYALAHKGKLDPERLEKFQGMDIVDKRKVLPMLSMLKEASDGRSWAEDTARAFMRSAIETPMKAGQSLYNAGVMALTQDDELYQTMIESQALLEIANEAQMQDWGLIGNAVIGVASTIPYAVYAASGLGTASIVMSTANDFEKRIAADGGDVSTPEVFFGKVAAGVAYAAVERAQFSRFFAPVKKMGTRQAFLKMFSSVNSALRVGGVVLMNTTAETLEESAQQGVEDGFVAMGLGRDVAAAAASGAAQEFGDSLGTMMLMSMGGAARQGARYKSGLFNSREELASTELLGLNLATKFASGDFGKQDVAQFGNELGMLFKGWMSAGGNDAEFAAQCKFDSGTARSLGNSFRSVYASLGGDAENLKTATGGQHVLDLGEQMSTAMPWLEVSKNDDGSYHVGRKAGAQEGTPNVVLRVELRPGSEFVISDEKLMDDSNDEFQSSIVEALRDHPSGLTLDGFRGMPIEERRKLVNEAELTSDGYYVAADQAGNEVSEQGLESMVPPPAQVEGTIVLNASILLTAQFHEMFHAVAAMMRDSGMMNDEMPSGLRALFGDPVTATEEFNEERAADAYRDYVTGKVDPVSKTHFDRFADYIGNLINIFRGLRHSEDADTDRFTQFVEAVRTGNFREIPTVLAKASAEQKPVAPVAEEKTAVPVGDNSSLSAASMDSGAPASVTPQEAVEQGKWTAVTPDGSMQLGGEWAFMELDDLIASNDDGYAQALQPRSRDAVASKLQVGRMASKLDPSRLMDAPTSDQGAPIVTADGMVLSGNGRTMAMRQANQGGQLGAYGDAVRTRAASMGVDVSGLRHPVLVRRLPAGMSVEELARAAELSNRPSILQRGMVEQAEADATTLVSSELLELMDTGESGDLSLASNRTFMNAFIERTGDQSLRLSDGSPSMEAYARVRRAALAAVFNGTPNYRDFLRLVFERGTSEDGVGVKRELDGITRAAPQLVRLARVNPDYALNSELALAFARYMDYRNTGGSPEGIEAFIAQGDMFADRDALSDGILRQIGLRHSSVLIGDLLQDYTNRAFSIDPTADMFGTPAMSPKELFDHSSQTTMPVDLAAVQAAEMERLRSLIAGAAKDGARHSVSGSWTGDAIQREVADATRQARERGAVSPRYSVTAAQDAEYMAAVDAGDEVAAQKMVDESAKATGYIIEAWHGTTAGSFNAFNAGSYFSESKEKAEEYTTVLQPDGSNVPKLYHVYIKPGIEKSVPFSTIMSEARDIVRSRKKDTTLRRAGILGGTDELVVKNPEQIKSADAITCDDQGNVIPLSERFNPKSNDIRYSIAAHRYAEKTGMPAEGENLVAKQLEILFGTDLEEKHGMSKAQRNRVNGMRSAYRNALENSDDPVAWQKAFEASKNGTVSRVIHDFFIEKDAPNHPSYKGQSDEFSLIQNGRSILGLKIETPQDMAALLMPLRNPYCESMKAIYLDADSRVIDARVFSIGVLDSALYHPREAFKPAVKMNAKKVVFARNHPSGDPAPSKEDYGVTKKMQASADFLGIELLDYIITNGNSFHSFKHGDFNYNGMLPDWEAVAAGATASVNTAERTAQLANTLRQGQGDFIHAIMLDTKMGITAVSRIPFDPSRLNDRKYISDYIARTVLLKSVQNPTKAIALDLTSGGIYLDLARQIHSMVGKSASDIGIQVLDSIFEQDGWACSVFCGADNRIMPLTPKAAEMSAVAVAETQSDIADTVEESLFSNGTDNRRYSVTSVKPWPKDFPTAIVHTTRANINNKFNDLFDLAKSGDVDSAYDLVENIVHADRIAALVNRHPNAIVVAVHAEEATGKNKIPEVYAKMIGKVGGLEVDESIVQSVRAKRTGEDAWYRMTHRPEFDGEVQSGREYIIVDDHLTMGGTVSELRSFIENGGGNVVEITSLTASQGSTTISISQETIGKLNDKFGHDKLLEQLKSVNITGELEALTESEGRYLLKLSPISLGNRIAEARQEGGVDSVRRDLGTKTRDSLTRNSFSAWFHPYDENSRINNRILVADVIATDRVKGIKRDESEYEMLAKARRVDLAEARKDADTVLSNIQGKAPSMDDIHKAMTANRVEDLYRAAMDSASKEAADAATIAQKGLMAAQKRSVEDAPDIDLMDFISETNIDPARDLTAIAPELFDPDYKPETKPDEEESKGGDGERAEPTEEQLRDVAEASEKRDSAYRKILDMLQAWRESQDVERARRERNEEAKAKGGAGSENLSDDEVSGEELPWMPPVVEGESVGVRTASEFAHLLRLGIERWIESRTKAANSNELWKNPANVETLRKSMQGMLRDIARKWIDPNAAIAYNAVLRSISEIPSSADPNGIELRASRIVGMIQRHAVRLSRKQLMKDLDTDIRELAVKGNVLDALEKEQNRKVKGEHEASARFLLKVLGWSDARCGKEQKLRADWLEARTRGYDEDDDSRGLEPATDAQIHRWQEEMNVIDRWGKLKYKMPAEIVRAGDEVRKWLGGARAEHEARFADVVARRDRVARAIMNAATLDPSTPKPDWGFGRKFADELTSTLRQRLEAIMFHGGKKMTEKERRDAQDALDEVMDIIAKGSEKYRTLTAQYANETQKCIDNAIKGTGMTYRQFIKLLDEKIPAALNAKIANGITQGMHTSMTWGNAAQLYAELRQTQSYGKNIELHNRQGQAKTIRDEMPVQILRFISGMREVYQHRRGELSDVQERVTGFPVRNPDPLYMPAKMFLEPHGELDIEINAWRPIPKAFAPRIENQRDFDESAHIMSVSTASMRNTALAIAFAESGLDLRSILARKDTYSAIERYHGKDAAQHMIQQVTDHLTAGYRQAKTSATDRAVRVASTIHTYSALSWNATSGLKQMASMPAWVPLLDGGYRELWGHLMTGLHDKAAIQELMASPGFMARYGSASLGAIFRDAWTDPSKTAVTRFYRAGMSAIQLGDFLASKAVAVGVYKAKRDDLISRGMPIAEARERAARDAWALVEEAQQSDRPENTPDFLRRHGFFAKQIYKFASSQMLQTSHEVHAFMQWKDAGFKDAKLRRRFVNTVIANHMMLPVAFTVIEQSIGLMLGGVPEDEEKWRKDVIANLLLEMTAGPYGRIVFVGSIARKLTGAALGAVGFKPRIYDAGALPSVEMVERLANRGSVTMSDIADADWESVRDDVLKMLGQLNVPIRYANKAWGRWIEGEKRK